jgi:hypothetical protein
MSVVDVVNLVMVVGDMFFGVGVRDSSFSLPFHFLAKVAT